MFFRGHHRQHRACARQKCLQRWQIAPTLLLSMKIAHGEDPSLGVRNRAPLPRNAQWNEGEAVRLAKGAWRSGYYGLASIIAVAWDTLFSPVDVRTLRERHRRVTSGKVHFDRSVDGRAKTGRPAIGTVAADHETDRSLRDKNGHGIFARRSAVPDRSGAPYRDDTLSDDFADVRALIFPGDKRRLMVRRRSGTVEAVAGGRRPRARQQASKLD
jgi:hypothetical protein